MEERGHWERGCSVNKREKGQFEPSFCNSKIHTILRFQKQKVKQQPDLAGFCLHGTLG